MSERGAKEERGGRGTRRRIAPVGAPDEAQKRGRYLKFFTEIAWIARVSMEDCFPQIPEKSYEWIFVRAM